MKNLIILLLSLSAYAQVGIVKPDSSTQCIQMGSTYMVEHTRFEIGNMELILEGYNLSNPVIADHPGQIFQWEVPSRVNALFDTIELKNGQTYEFYGLDPQVWEGPDTVVYDVLIPLVVPIIEGTRARLKLHRWGGYYDLSPWFILSSSCSVSASKKVFHTVRNVKEQSKTFNLLGQIMENTNSLHIRHSESGCILSISNCSSSKVQ